MTLEKISDYLSGKIYDLILPKFSMSFPVIFDIGCCVCVCVLVFSCYMIIMNKKKYVNNLYYSFMFYTILRLMSVIFTTPKV